MFNILNKIKQVCFGDTAKTNTAVLPVPPTADNVINTIANVATEHYGLVKATRSAKYAESVETAFKHMLEYFDPMRDIASLKKSEVQQFAIYLMEKAPKGHRVYIRNFKAIFNKLLTLDIVETNPFVGLSIPKKSKDFPVFFLREELDRLIEALPNTSLRMLVYTGFFSGLRRDELINLKWKSIDFSQKLIVVGDSDFATKTRAQRIVPICEPLLEKLLPLRAQVKNENQYVFCKENGFKYSKDYVTHTFKAAVLKAGLNPEYHFHSLRHGFASYLVQNKVPLYNVKDLLGHASVTTTEIYSHLDSDALTQSISIFNNNKGGSNAA